MRSLAATGLNVLIAVLLVVAGLIGWGVTEYRRAGPLARETVIEIPQGARLERIAALLAEAGAVSNATVFRLGARYEAREQGMRYGVYTLPPGASMSELALLLSKGGRNERYRATFGLRAEGVQLRLVDTLSPDAVVEDPAAALVLAVKAGSSVEFRVSVPEGLMSSQIVEGLRKIEHLAGDVATIPAEGSLAPDTYSFSAGTKRQALLDQMAAAQTKILAAAWEARQADLPVTTPEEALILASIVEKETGVAAERPLVAGVFVNRLRAGMRLETDPTVIYGLTEGRKVLDRPLTRGDLRRRTPYNTYVIDGLPPTPIANPGRAAITAALNPAKTGYLFFVADGTGGHAFAETLTDHQKNVAKWRRIEADRARVAPVNDLAQP